MRVKSEFWAKAYLRRCMSAGASAVVVRHGDDDAGAIYLRINRLDGTSLLFGPAAAGLDDMTHGRLFAPLLGGGAAADAAVDAALDREARIDSDLWIVEVEDRDGRHFLGDAVVAG